MSIYSPGEVYITTSTPFVPVDTPQLIDGCSSIDDRSAVDQLIEIFSTLNVLVSRRGISMATAQPENYVSDSERAAYEEMESLLAVDEYEMDDDSTIEVGNVVRVGQVNGGDAAAEVQDTPTFGPSAAMLNYQLNNLVFLGFISAVESYFRCLTRQIVLVDEFVADKVSEQKITFGAALHSHRALLPEAFLEDMSFISKDSVDKLLTQIIGIKSQKLSGILEEYNRICQLRHCIVHRFGKLGTNNAIKLGLNKHKQLLEKPIQIGEEDLSTIAHTLVNLVKAVNNHVYEEVLERSAKNSNIWTWDYRRDKKVFAGLYKVFASELSPSPSPSCKDAYNAFRNKFKSSSATVLAQRRNLGRSHR